MQAIILAAGYGGRLTPATDSTPKTLLDLDKGITILDRQLDAMKKVGIKKISIVVGFQAEKIDEKIAQRNDLDLEISIYYNPFYRVTNNLVSLWVARAAMGEDFIMINGDNVFKPSILKTLKESEELLTVMISKKKQYDADDTKLKLSDSKIIRLGKDIPLDEIDAEWIGMCAVRGQMRELFVKKLDELIRIPHLLDGKPHYLSLFQGLIDDGHPLYTIEIEPGSWAEIDYQMDLEFVRSHLTRFAD
jgi:L-glutamine-phosphate cytidylyltransferase